MNTSDAITLRGFSRHFKSGKQLVKAVDNIDLTVSTGEIVAFLGPNGAGKTTTIDALLGLITPTAGEVSVLGMTPRRAAASGEISAVLQTGGLLADLTVRETVSVFASMHRDSRGVAGRVSDRIDNVLERAQLTELQRRKISKISGGERQRVKFAIALIPEPEVLILDEPTAGMDATARRRFWDSMREEADAGRTIMFATHYLEEAEQFARRTVVISHGEIVADEETASLRSSLGGRELAVTLPGSADEVAAVAERLDADPAITGLTRNGSRIHLRAPDTDAVASELLALGGTELEITAPTLESAFTSLTED